MKKKTTAGVTTVPAKYAGQWIAWNHDHSKIVASVARLQEARQKARQAGEESPWLDSIPEKDTYFSGAAF